MTAHLSFAFSGIALAASLACMPSHAGWLSDLFKKDGSGAAYYEDSGWGDAAGTSTAVTPPTTSTPTATSPTPAERPTLTARPARTVADSTGSVALTGVAQRWKDPLKDLDEKFKREGDTINNNFNNINAKVDGMGAATPWSTFFKNQERCDSFVCAAIDGNGYVNFRLKDSGKFLGTVTPIGFLPAEYFFPPTVGSSSNCVDHVITTVYSAKPTANISGAYTGFYLSYRQTEATGISSDWGCSNGGG